MTKVHEAEIVEISEETAVGVFDGSVKLVDVLESIAITARSITADASTSAGRKELSSVAYKVARSKTLIDSTGKAAVDGIKAQAKAIDSQRKEARDFLDGLRDEIKAPVIEWEAEQQRKIDEEVRKEEEAKAKAEAERIADIERREAELKAKEDAIKAAEAEAAAKELAEQQEKARIEREAQIAKEAAERATREVEQNAERERQEAIQREQDAKEALERAQREKVEAAEMAAREQAAAVQKAKDDAAAEAARILAANEEAERKAREAAEKKAANTRHQAKINNEAVKSLEANGITDAKALVVLIAKGKINNVTINY